MRVVSCCDVGHYDVGVCLIGDLFKCDEIRVLMNGDLFSEVRYLTVLFGVQVWSFLRGDLYFDEYF